MTPLLLALMIFAIMLVLMAIRTPIAIAMFLAGATGYITQAGWSPLASFLNTQAFARFASYDLSVIPLFILMGQFATQGGISKALFGFAAALMGRFQGGLAMAAVLASAAFGAICGSSVATAATITSVALPEMKRHGYSGRLSTGTLAAGGTLGILIPPSVPLVIYAILAEQNIAKLFAAAMVPGLIAMLGYMAAIAHLCAGGAGSCAHQRPWRRTHHAAHAAGGAADPADLSAGVRRHLRRPVHADRRCRGRGGRDLPGGAGPARTQRWPGSGNVFLPPPRARR
jgi:tripartite ATP-independent transporter DctM subunit